MKIKTTAPYTAFNQNCNGQLYNLIVDWAETTPMKDPQFFTQRASQELLKPSESPLRTALVAFIQTAFPTDAWALNSPNMEKHHCPQQIQELLAKIAKIASKASGFTTPTEAISSWSLVEQRLGSPMVDYFKAALGNTEYAKLSPNLVIRQVLAETTGYMRKGKWFPAETLLGKACAEVATSAFVGEQLEETFSRFLLREITKQREMSIE